MFVISGDCPSGETFPLGVDSLLAPTERIEGHREDLQNNVFA